MPEAKVAKKPARRKKRPEGAPKSRGIAADALGSGSPPAAVTRLAEAIESDGGSVLATYRDPLGGHWQLLAGLPIDLVEPTPYQRDLSDAHVAKLCSALDRLGRYLDPVIVVRNDEGRYWTPNGNHRLAALRTLGARAAVAIVVPEPEVARRILLLNTEKAHNLRERALEVARLAENLALLDDRPEREFETEFEEPALITLGLCYMENGRFAGGAYHPVLKRIDKFLGSALPMALEIGVSAPPGDGARGGGGGGREGAQGAGVRQPVSPRVRGGTDQPAPVQARRQGGVRRDDRPDDRLGEPVRRGEGESGPGGAGVGAAGGGVGGVNGNGSVKL
jgi:ParB-like nuclease domain.